MSSYSCANKVPSVNYVTRISWFFTPTPSLSQVVTFLRPLPPTKCDVTYFAILRLEIIKLRVGAASNSAKWTLNTITCKSVKLFNAFQWHCFNLVDTCNIALILFLKCDVTKFQTRPLVTQCHTSSIPSSPLNVWRNLWMAPYLSWKRKKGAFGNLGMIFAILATSLASWAVGTT